MRALRALSIAMAATLFGCDGPLQAADAGSADADLLDADIADATIADGGRPDLEPPVVLSSDPADGASPVSVLTVFSVAVSEPLDPASVNEETVELTDTFGNRIAGGLVYDLLTQTIRFDPALALRADQELTLRIGAIRDEAGNTAEPVTIRARTYANPERATTSYSSLGALGRYSVIELDEAGLYAGETAYFGPGADGTWRTADDEIESVSVLERTESQLVYRSYDDPGPDGAFRTADDPLSDVYIVMIDEHRRPVRAYGFDAGPDGVLETSDDARRGSEVTDYDVSGLIEREAYYNDPGPDGEWSTADDIAAARASVVEYDVFGRDIGSHSYTSPGPDGVWFTADDIPRTHTTIAYDDVGRTFRLIAWTRGADGVEGTEDDAIVSYQSGRLDGHGRSLGHLHCGRAGVDGEWFTEDDVVSQRRARTFAAHDNLETDVYYSQAGEDGIWGTADDQPQTVREFDTER